MEKAEDIQFHPWNKTYIFMTVKYNFLYFHGCGKTAFLKFIFNQYFPVFHYFVYNKTKYLDRLTKPSVFDMFREEKQIWAATWDFQQCGMCDQQSLRSAWAYAQSNQSLC